MFSDAIYNFRILTFSIQKIKISVFNFQFSTRHQPNITQNFKNKNNRIEL